MLASATSTSPGSQPRGHGADPLDVGIRIAADFELETAIALGAIAGDVVGHRLGRFLRDGAVERESLRHSGRRAASQTGKPAALPRMSQQAMSIADFT